MLLKHLCETFLPNLALENKMNVMSNALIPDIFFKIVNSIEICSFIAFTK